MPMPVIRQVVGHALVLILLSMSSACVEQPADDEQASDVLRVAVTILPQVWLVQSISPDAVVVCLTQPGDSPETFQPGDARISDVLSADVYFTIGVPCERGPWFAAIQQSRTHVVPLVEEPAHDHNHDHEHDHDHAHDAHAWLSPPSLSAQAGRIATTLKEIQPHRAAEYEARLAAFQQRMQVLDEDLRNRLEPYRGSTFFVVHPAWGVFAQRYGLKQYALEHAGRPPTDSEMTAFQQAARAAGARVLFTQPQDSPHLARSAAAAINARLELIDPLVEDVAGNLEMVADKLIASLQRGEDG